MMRKNCQISPVPFNSSSLPVNTQVAVLGNPKAREPLDFVSRGETSEKSLPESAIFVPQTGAGADIAASKINAGTCSSDKGQSSPLASKTDTTKMSLFEVNGSQLSPDCDKNAGASILPDSVNEAEKLPKKSSRTAEPSVSVLNDMKDNLSSLKCASSNTAAVVNTNATNINCTVLKTDASSSPAQANGILSDNRHISVNRFAELFYSIDVMNVIREKVWKVLQPRLRCERGKNDSPVFALPLLVRDHPSLKKMFKMEYTFSFRCEICSYKQEDSHFKILPSFPAVPADFTMKEPCFVRNCFQCNAPNQRMKMEFKTLPNVLLFHFMQGLPHNRFADLDFSFHGDQYTVTAFVQYKHNPDHFVAWVRNGSGNQWMECDDLKSQLCRFQQGFPDIPCGQIHIMMLEKNLTDSSVKLLEDTATSKLLASLLMVTDGLASSSPNQSCGSPSMNMKAQKESGFKQTGVKYIVTSPNTSCLQAGSSGGALMSGNLPSVMPAGVSVVPRSVSVPLKAGTLQATLSPGLQAVAPRGLLGGTSSLTSSLPVQGHQNVRIVVLNSQGGVTNAGVLSNVSSGLPVANLLQSCQGVCNTQGDTSVTNTCADVNQDVKVLTPQKRKDPDTKLINDLKLQGSSLCSPAKRSKVIRKQVAVKTGSPQVNVSVQPSVLPSSAPTRQIIIKTFNSQGQEVKTSNMGHVDISRLLQTNTDSKPNITSALLKHLISGSKPNVAFSPSKIVIPDVQQPAEIKSPGQLGGIIQQQTSVSLPGVLNSTTGSLSNAPCLNKVTTVKSSAGSGLSLQQLLVSVSKSRVSNQNASNAVSHGQHQHAKVNSTADASNTVSQAPVSTVSVNTEADQSSGNPVDRTSLAVKTSSSGHVLHVNSAVSAGNLLKMTQFYQGSKARPVTVRKTHTPNLLKCSKTAVVTSDGLPTQNAASQITSQPVSGNNMSPPTSVKHPALLLASSVTNITQIKPVASTGTISIPPAVSGGRVLSSPLVVSQTPASTVSVQSEASKDSSAVTQYLSSVLKTPQRVDKCVAVPLGKGVDTGVKVSVGQPSSTRTNKIVLTKQNALSVLKAAFTGKPPESYLEAVKPFLNINVGDTGGTTIKQKSFEGYRPRNTLSDQVSEASSVDIPASDSRCANQTGLLSSKVLNKEPLPQGRARGRGSVVVVSKNKPPSVQIAPPSVGVPPPVATSSVETMTSQNHLLQGTQGKDDDVSPVFSPGPSAASLDNYYVVEQSVGKPGRGRGRGRGRGQGRGRGRGRARVKTSAAGLVTVGTADVMSGSSDQAPAVVGDITTLGATTMFHTAVASPGRTLSMQTRKGGHTSSHEPDANKINNQSVIKTQNSKKGSQTLLKNSHYYIVSSAEPSLTGNMCAALQRPGRKRKAPPFPQKLQVKSCKSVVSSITGDAQTDKNMTSGNSEESKVLQNLYEALNLSPPPSYGANRNSRLDVGVSDVESNTVNIFENGIPVNDINPDVYMSGDFMMDTDESLPSVAENVEI